MAKWCRLSFCLAGLFCLAACSTKKNNFFTRNYHNLTSYYNVYWNGVEALKEAEDVIKEKVTENYYDVLPVLKTVSDKDTSLTSPYTDRVIEKAMIAVKKHSIVERGVEYVKFIDDAYLLMAQGLFYQRDFSHTRTVLNMVMSDFPKNPERFDAMLLSARTYIQEEEYDMAIGFLAHVADQPEKDLRKDTRVLLPQVQAEYFLFQEEYDKAEPYLQEALAKLKDRDQRARILFILGQIAQRKGQNVQANNYYKACLKLNPPLAMSFNATLNRALCYDPESFSADDIIKTLQRLLKDPKNSAYFGRIYYVLGEIAFTDGDEEAGVEYMNLSLDASANDPERMLLAAKKLAEYYYDKADYIGAERYYTMAARHVEEDDEAYYTITSRSKYLTELVKYYRVLGAADTVRMLYRMSEADRLAYGEQQAAAYKQRQAEAQKKAAAAAAVAGASAPVSGAAASWYFYNNQARSAGYNEFVRRWGRRELVDLWCFAVKPPAAALRALEDEDDEGLGEDTEDNVKELTPEDAGYYLTNIPESDSAMRPYDSIVENALYRIGVIYFDRLDEDEQGEPYFLRLIEEFPRSAYIPSAYENLCKIYHKRGDTERYQRYADLLARQYPGTEQDQRINDPTYFEKLSESEQEIQTWYEQAYEFFSANRFMEMLDVVNRIERRYPVNKFKPQLMFLRAVGLAHTSGYEEMIVLLENFKNSYPDHELNERVDVLLERARREAKRTAKPETPPVLTADETAGDRPAIDPTTAIASGPQKTAFADKDPYAAHSVIFICEKTKLNARAMRIRMEDINRKFHADLELSVETEDLGEKNLMFVISSFRDLERAGEYAKSLADDTYVFSTVKPQDGFWGEISDDNLEILRKSHNAEEYRTHYKNHYGK
ncbi:MAG: tetratricopeptide repeat protein [Bacteroidales bacterium]|nr:tetratricopeptide repeat protein [Bacteroidales bacterium]